MVQSQENPDQMQPIAQEHFTTLGTHAKRSRKGKADLDKCDTGTQM